MRTFLCRRNRKNLLMTVFPVHMYTFMCVCMYLCMHACLLVCLCMQVCAFAYMRVLCMHSRFCKRVYACCVHACMHVYVGVCMCVVNDSMSTNFQHMHPKYTTGLHASFIPQFLLFKAHTQYVCTCIHIHTYIHTYITKIHTYMHGSHSNAHTYMHTRRARWETRERERERERELGKFYEGK
jgi:hypothetical protein